MWRKGEKRMRMVYTVQVLKADAKRKRPNNVRSIASLNFALYLARHVADSESLRSIIQCVCALLLWELSSILVDIFGYYSGYRFRSAWDAFFPLPSFALIQAHLIVFSQINIVSIVSRCCCYSVLLSFDLFLQFGLGDRQLVALFLLNIYQNRSILVTSLIFLPYH